MAQDYILRMIQQLAAMVAGIIAKKQRGELIAAADEVEEKCLQTIGLPLSLVKRSSPEVLRDLLASGGGLGSMRTLLLAELLFQDAELAELRGNPPDAVISYRLATQLLADAIHVLGEDDQKTLRARMDHIAAKLRDLA